MNVRRIWYWFAVSAAGGNVLAAAYVAATMNQPTHVAAHMLVAGAFGVAASRIRHRWQRERAEKLEDPDEKVLMLQENVSDLERELYETRQRLEFADQLLKTKKPEE